MTMLTSAFGIRLLLLVGKTIPVPPPPGLADALVAAEVTNDASNQDGFKLTFNLTRQAIDFDLLRTEVLAPQAKVTLALVVRVVPEVLINGVITRCEVVPSSIPGSSQLVVYGKDASHLLSFEERNAKFPLRPDFAIFAEIIKSYAPDGLIPDPRSTADVPLLIHRIPRQAESDLAFIRRLAKKNGYVFYVEPLTIGTSRAYFGPAIRAGIPQPAITTNMGADDNASGLSFQYDAEAATGSKGTFIEPFLKLPIPLPQLPSLRIPPLAARPAPTLRTTLTRDTAKKSVTAAATAGLAASMNAKNAITGSGQLDGARYGSILRARGVVGVRGVGYEYSGNYYVESVTHDIRRGAYTQSFSLSREGTGAMLPFVRP